LFSFLLKDGVDQDQLNPITKFFNDHKIEDMVTFKAETKKESGNTFLIISGVASVKGTILVSSLVNALRIQHWDTSFLLDSTLPGSPFLKFITSAKFSNGILGLLPKLGEEFAALTPALKIFQEMNLAVKTGSIEGLIELPIFSFLPKEAVSELLIGDSKTILGAFAQVIFAFFQVPVESCLQLFSLSKSVPTINLVLSKDCLLETKLDIDYLLS